MAWVNVTTADTPGVANYIWNPGTLQWEKMLQPSTGGASGGNTSTSYSIDGPVRLGTSTTAATLFNTALSSGIVTLSSDIGVSSGNITLTASTQFIGRITTSTEIIGTVYTLSTGGGSGSTSVSLDTSTAAIGRVFVTDGLIRLGTSTTAAEVAKVGIGSTGIVLATLNTSTHSGTIGVFTLGTSTSATERMLVGIGSTGAVTLNAGTAQIGALGTSTANIGIVDLDTSTAEIGRVIASTGGALAAVYITTAAVSKISSSPGVLWKIWAISTSTGTNINAIQGLLRLHNVTTGSVTGATPVACIPVMVVATTTAATSGYPPGGDNTINFGPRGLAFGTACSVDVTTNSTGTTTLANAKITAMYST